jgi:hypothetical protein
MYEKLKATIGYYPREKTEKSDELGEDIMK